MALTIMVSKVSVTKQMKGLLNIHLNLLCKAMLGSPSVLTEVINQNFSTRFRPGLNNISDKEEKLQLEMQKTIDDYKQNQQIFNHAQLDAVVDNLNTNLTG